jgi:hypothetical protein
MSARLYPDPPHIDLAFCFAGTDARESMDATCNALSDRLAVPTGERDVLISSKEPVFSALTDLEVYQADGKDSDSRLQPDSWLMRAGYLDELLGLLVAQYGGTRGYQPLRYHPICVTLGGGKLEFDEDAPADEVARSTLAGDRVRSLFKSVCELGSVLYGAVLFERQLPSPLELLNPAAELSPELFVSDIVRDTSRTNEKLESLLTQFSSEEWKKGKYWSGLYAFNAERRTVSVAPQIPNQVATIVGSALRSFA